MPTKEEIEEIISWAEKRKREEGRLVLVERNPFREKIPWTFRFPTIEIDRPKEVANKHSLVYDSTTKTLWVYELGRWKKVEPDPEGIEE